MGFSGTPVRSCHTSRELLLSSFLLFLNYQMKIPFHSLVFQEWMKMNFLGSIGKMDTSELGGLAVAAEIRSHRW